MGWRLDNVFGMNRRNRELVLALNPPTGIRLVNDKIACKQAMIEHGVTTPELIADIRVPRQIHDLYPRLLARDDGFVLKPSNGALGRGVIIFARALEDQVLPQHGAPMSRRDFVYTICCILNGEYTKGRPIDAALIEERIRPDTEWIVPELPGAPDLRIIVHRGTPVMGMVRLPTIASSGRANLHRGGVGLGIDFEAGRTTHAVWKGLPITHHPDSGIDLRGRAIEGWDECVELARRCGEAVPLGYMGVDIMRDRRKGPCVLEINARPGLAIQIANRKGLGNYLVAEVGRIANLSQSPSHEQSSTRPISTSETARTDYQSVLLGDLEDERANSK